MPHSLSSLFLKQLVVSASTTLSGRLLQTSTRSYPLTVEKFPGVETASRLVQFESVSTKIMATIVQYEKFTTINVLFFSQYFVCLDEISSDSSLFKCGQPNTFKSLFIG